MGGRETITLDGIINSVHPDDPEDCFNRPPEYYEGLQLLIAEIDGQPNVLHACGDTNTGVNFNGCHHGVVENAINPDPSDCPHYEPTGEMVIAQAALLECEGYVLDPTFAPLVLVAQIGEQWFIVNVISGDAFSLINISHPPCVQDDGSSLCCAAGNNDLLIDMQGCSLFDGLQIVAISNNNGSWSGSITRDGITLTVQITCDDLNPNLIPPANGWSVSVGCNGILTEPTDSGFDCDGSGTDNVIGGFSISGSLFQCGDCTTLSFSVRIGPLTANDHCRAVELTGELVIAEACGLEGVIEVGDYVIMAKVPKLSPACGTGTGSGTGDEPLNETATFRWITSAEILAGQQLPEATPLHPDILAASWYYLDGANAVPEIPDGAFADCLACEGSEQSDSPYQRSDGAPGGNPLAQGQTTEVTCSCGDDGTGTDENCVEDIHNPDCPTPSVEEFAKSQWQIIQVSSKADCTPCPPPPPPPESECCGLEPSDIPTSLIGTVRITSTAGECNCEVEIPISFTLFPGSVPARWIQDENAHCDDVGEHTGSGIGGAVLMDLTGMIVTCGGEQSGSDEGSDSGTSGQDAAFFLTYPDCANQPSEGAVESTDDACDPVQMKFTADISSCCGPHVGLPPHPTVTMVIELVGV